MSRNKIVSTLHTITLVVLVFAGAIRSVQATTTDSAKETVRSGPFTLGVAMGNFLYELDPITGDFAAINTVGFASGLHVTYAPDGFMYGIGYITKLLTWNRWTGLLVRQADLPWANTGIVIESQFAGVATGPDGNVVVGLPEGILQSYDIQTRLFRFMGAVPTEFYTGRINQLVFGKDGSLYVRNSQKSILRFNGRTGKFLSLVVSTAQDGDLRNMAIGPNDGLYVVNSQQEIIHFDPITGANYGVFAHHELDADYSIFRTTFAPDGDLYATFTYQKSQSGGVLRFDGKTGAFKRMYGGTWLGSPRSIIVLPNTQPPTAASLQLSPENPTTLDDIVAVASGSVDPGGKNITYSYAWYRDNQLVNSVDGPVFSHELTSHFNKIECIATPNDGIADGIPGIASVHISNTPPTRPEIQILPDNPTRNTGMAVWFAEESIDIDEDLVVYLYEWYESTDGSNWRRRPEISGSPPPAYEAGESEISELYTNFIQAGEHWRVDVTPLEIFSDISSDKKSVAQSETLKNLVVSQDFSHGPIGSSQVFILPDLDGNDEVDSTDLLTILANWHRPKDEIPSDLRRLLFDVDNPIKDRISSTDLLNIVQSWNRSVWD